jgi:hypothetical protein
VTDAWVTLGGGTDIYKYEASRPDASGVSSGALGTRACSVSGRLPWTNVTYAQASAACKAADPNGRLCMESEWEQACMNDSMGSCTWGFPGYPACNTWASTQCNGADYASTPNIQTSGNSGSSGACYRGPTNDATKQIFEITGNVKEYVLKRSTGAIPVRGGATNNTQDGMRCDFDFPVWPDNSPFTNVGFRCCRNPDPLPPICTTTCTTFPATGLNVSNATLATHTIAVSGVTGPVVDVNVTNFTGNHTTMSQVDYTELAGPDATTIRLTNASYCGSNDNWSYKFDQAAGALPPSNTSPCGNGNTYQPNQSLNMFNSKDPNGNWTIRVHDNDQAPTGPLCGIGIGCQPSPAPTITAWAVQVCTEACVPQ